MRRGSPLLLFGRSYNISITNAELNVVILSSHKHYKMRRTCKLKPLSRMIFLWSFPSTPINVNAVATKITIPCCPFSTNMVTISIVLYSKTVKIRDILSVCDHLSICLDRTSSDQSLCWKRFSSFWSFSCSHILHISLGLDTNSLPSHQIQSCSTSMTRNSNNATWMPALHFKFCTPNFSMLLTQENLGNPPQLRQTVLP